MPNQNRSDRNLLAGVLALQMSLINESQLIKALQQWVFQKTAILEDILVQQQALNQQGRKFVNDMVEQFLQLHQNDSDSCLQAISSLSSSVANKLLNVGDADIEMSVTLLLNAQSGTDVASNSEETTSLSPMRDSSKSRFRILRPHAEGGLGRVSVAQDRELNRQVALKQIKPAYSKDVESRSRFLIEAEVTGRLEHPGIVPVYSLGTTGDGDPFYVMRFIHGDSLKEAIASLHAQMARLSSSEKRMRLRQLVRRLIDVCFAVNYAHNKGVLHRDLKPGNIMLGKYGETLVVDWGLARVGNMPVGNSESILVPPHLDLSSATRMGSVVGSISYMSPEQAAGRLDLLGPASDVYSLGATLYCILTGRPPVSAKEDQDAIDKVIKADFPEPRQLNPDAPKVLTAICLKAMAREIGNRYPTAAELSDDLEMWLADESTKAYRESFAERTLRWLRRHQTLATSLAVGLMTAAVGLGGITAVLANRNRELRNANFEIQAAVTLAENHLTSARKLAIEQLKTAEEVLSKPQLGARTVLNLRHSLTDQTVADFEKWHAENPANPTIADEYAHVLRVASNLRRSARKFPEARALLKRSLELQEAVPASSLTDQQKDALALTLVDHAMLERLEGKLSSALKQLDKASSLAESLSPEFAEPKVLLTRSTIQLERSTVLPELEKYDEALQACRLSQEGYRKRMGAEGVQTDVNLSLYLIALLIEVRALESANRLDEALACVQRAIVENRELLAKHSIERGIRFPLMALLNHQTSICLKLDLNTEQINDWLDESLKHYAILKEGGSNASHLAALSTNHQLRAAVKRKQNQLQDSLVAVKEAVAQAENLVKLASIPEYHTLLAMARWELARTQSQLADSAVAASYASAIESQSKACELSAESSQARRLLESIRTASQSQ
jgi:eukaryotic-like serine/threonine-protein kinase